MGKIITRIPIDDNTVIFISDYKPDANTITYYECVGNATPEKITTVFDIDVDNSLLFDNYFLTPDLIRIIEKNLDVSQ